MRHQLATEPLAEIVVLDAKMKASDKALRKAVAATGTGLLDLYGIGPASATRALDSDEHGDADREERQHWIFSSFVFTKAGQSVDVDL